MVDGDGADEEGPRGDDHEGRGCLRRREVCLLRDGRKEETLRNPRRPGSSPRRLKSQRTPGERRYRETCGDGGRLFHATAVGGVATVIDRMTDDREDLVGCPRWLNELSRRSRIAPETRGKVCDPIWDGVLWFFQLSSVLTLSQSKKPETCNQSGGGFRELQILKQRFQACPSIFENEWDDLVTRAQISGFDKNFRDYGRSLLSTANSQPNRVLSQK